MVETRREEVQAHFLCKVSSTRSFLRFYRRLLCSFANIRGVEREVGFHTSLDAPGQFLGLSCFRPRQNIPRTENGGRLSNPIRGFKRESKVLQRILSKLWFFKNL